MEKDETIKSKKAIIGVTLVILIVLIGVTYAAFVYQKSGTKESKLRTGTLILELDDKTADGIVINPAVPILDEDTETIEGLDSYRFTLRNTGTGNASYRISLVDDEDEYKKDACSEKRLPHKFIKIGLDREGTQLTPFTLENSDVIDEGTLEANGGSIEYNMKIWIDSLADNSIGGTHFHGRIKLEGIVAGRTNYKTGE